MKIKRNLTGLGKQNKRIPSFQKMESLKKTKNMKTILNTFIFLLIAVLSFSQQNRGFKSINIEIDGQITELYKQSHALVIGVSDYTNGWSKLPGVANDVEDVKQALESNGFNVVVIENLTSSKLKKRIDNFISKYGHEENNRLLFYFSGHGFTNTMSWGGEMGYFVPVDAPNPSVNKSDFLDKALNMEMIEVYAKRIDSKHALFLFDCCFSGSIFALSKSTPPVISYKTKKPVRQFITAGSADEEVPDESIFCKQFIEALKGDGDGNKDGYLTGSELGEYLQTTVINYSYENQHPQYGKIRNANLDKGDFVFFLLPPQKVQQDQQKKKISKRKISISEESYSTYGTLKLTTEISGSLYIDGNFLKNINKNTIVTLGDISAGSHNIEIKGDNNWSETINIAKAQTTNITAKNTAISLPTTIATTNNDNMIFVKGGCFNMGIYYGSSNEKPVHEVCVDDFFIGKYEVTNEEYCEFLNEKGNKIEGKVTWLDISKNNCKIEKRDSVFLPKRGYEKHPVIQVSWFGAIAYCKWKDGRLPTEAEWEYAASGGSKSNGYKYSGSNYVDDVAWYKIRAGIKTYEVGKKQANELGIFDMSGNVSEWCNDRYEKEFLATYVVHRGGSCNLFSNTKQCRVTNRSIKIPFNSDSYLGFRLVKDK